MRPPFARLTRGQDADLALTRRIEDAVRALGKGGAEVAALESLTAGARRSFSQAPWRPVPDLRGMTFVTEQAVAGRGLVRHDAAIDRIRYYAATTSEGERSLLVWVTKDGLLADFDTVDD